VNIGLPSQLKYQWVIFTHPSLGRLYPHVEQRCPCWSRDSGEPCESL